MLQQSRILSFQQHIPCSTRWNSKFDAVKRLLEFGDNIGLICEELGKPKLKQVWSRLSRGVRNCCGTSGGGSWSTTRWQALLLRNASPKADTAALQTVCACCW